MTAPTHMEQKVASALAAVPTELWLNILEQLEPDDASHLWTSVRLVSTLFWSYVERHWLSTHVPKLNISLALPRRDPATGALKWPGDAIPRASMIFSFHRIAGGQQCVILKSPESLGLPGEMKSVDELRRAGCLPEERLREASSWVWIGKSHLTGVSVVVKGRFCWDHDRKVWTWEVDWRKLVTHFYQAKRLQQLIYRSRSYQSRVTVPSRKAYS